MYLIVISIEDPASVNIRERLLEIYDWDLQHELKFEDNDVYKFSNKALMVTINKYHLFYDNIDQRLVKSLGNQGFSFTADVIMFASKHRSSSGMKTLSVHPIGNYNKAEYGGKPNELVPSAPHAMTMAYRILNKIALERQVEYSVSFEATHHGPYLDTPSFFIEIGSEETAWVDKNAGEVIAKTIFDLINLDLEVQCKDYPVAIGIGGGHYAPRHSDLARKKQISIGHIIPTYAMGDIPEKMFLRAIEQTPNATHVYFHQKALKKEQYRSLKAWYEERKYQVVRSDDLEDII